MNPDLLIGVALFLSIFTIPAIDILTRKYKARRSSK